jgi:hypothetical protein
MDRNFSQLNVCRTAAGRRTAKHPKEISDFCKLAEKKSGAAISIGFRRLARSRHHILPMYHDAYVPLAAVRGH